MYFTDVQVRRLFVPASRWQPAKSKLRRDALFGGASASALEGACVGREVVIEARPHADLVAVRSTGSQRSWDACPFNSSF